MGIVMGSPRQGPIAAQTSVDFSSAANLQAATPPSGDINISQVTDLGNNQYRASGASFGTHALDIEFVGGPSGHLETSPLGQDSSFGNWLLADSPGFDAAKVIVDDAERGQVWYADSSAASGSQNATFRYDRGSTIGENEKVYISWMTKRRKNVGDGQWKMFRISYENDISDDGGEATWFNWTGGNPDQLIFRPESGPSGGQTTGLFGGGLPSTDDKWFRMEWELTTSTEGVKDGLSVLRRHDRDDTPDVTGWSWSQEQSPLYPAVITYNNSRRYRWFLWQNFRGNGLTDHEIWMDDAYIQVGTFARIEIGDNADYGLANRLEIQRPLSWADGQIDFELNLGGFSPTDNLYLYVINDSDEVSDGFLLSI